MSRRRDVSVLVDLLSHSLGSQVASERARAAIKKLGFDATQLSEEEALLVLDEMSKEKGIVGTGARFTKARLVLVWAQG
jgi:hypothetical protein